MSNTSAFNMNSINNINNLSQNIINSSNNFRNNNIKDLDSSFRNSLSKENEYNYDNWYRDYLTRNRQTSSFSELTLMDIYKNSINTYQNIILELTDLFSSNKIFLKINMNNRSIYKIIYIYLKNISAIILKSDRLLYVGILLCIISFFIYFIFVTK